MVRTGFDDGFGDESPPPSVRMGFPVLTPAVKRLMLLNAGVFLVCFLAFFFWEAGYVWILHTLGLDPQSWRENAPLVPLWQLVSYGFLHSVRDPSHILFNMLTLYFFGVMLEREIGARRFVLTYLAAQVLGGVFFLVLALATGSEIPLIGASGACFGVMVAAATLWPRAQVLFIFIPLTLRTLALIFVGIEFYLFLMAFKGAPSDGVSHVTHLGGIVYGFVAVRTGLIRWDPVRAWGERRSAKAVESAAADEQRMDQLLEKIHKQGMSSLTSGEREFLKRVSSRR